MKYLEFFVLILVCSLANADLINPTSLIGQATIRSLRAVSEQSNSSPRVYAYRKPNYSFAEKRVCDGQLIKNLGLAAEKSITLTILKNNLELEKWNKNGFMNVSFCTIDACAQFEIDLTSKQPAGTVIASIPNYRWPCQFPISTVADLEIKLNVYTNEYLSSWSQIPPVLRFSSDRLSVAAVVKNPYIFTLDGGNLQLIVGMK